MRQKAVHVDGADLHAGPGQMVVLVENTYAECGRESARRELVPEPDAAEDADAWFAREDSTEDDPSPHDLTGDGHLPCGRWEDCLSVVTIVEAPGRPDLVGAYFEFGI